MTTEMATPVRPRGWVRVLVLYLPLIGLLATVFVDRSLWDPRSLDMHQKVLAGTAPNVAQFQLPAHEVVLDLIFRLSPRRSSGIFSLLYIAYYGLGLILFFEALYRTCARHAGAAASLMAGLYYVATVPMLWYDNWYHPSDPWGALLSIFLVRKMFDPSPTRSYYGLLLLSGFVWDKSVFFPLSRAASDLIGGRSKTRVVAEFALGSALAAAGQLAFRWYYGYQAAGVGSLAQNLRNLHLYLLGLAVFQGPAIVYLFRNLRRTPAPFLGLMAQTPAWLALYFAMNGYIWEFRAIFLVSVAYAAPIVAMFCERYLAPPAKGGGYINLSEL
ncbi:MAG: hypothetical protein U0835_01375 [Isosphaeraceae bacterium]